MARTCTICTHPERQAIDAALVAGEPFRNIAQRFSVSTTALFRHKGEHLPATLAKAKAAADEAFGDDLLGQVRMLQAKAMGQLGIAEKAGSVRDACAAIREARACLELQAKLLGELETAPTVNIVTLPEWMAIRGAVVASLAPYPEAKAAVAARLVTLEAGRVGS